MRQWLGCFNSLGSQRTQVQGVILGETAASHFSCGCKSQGGPLEFGEYVPVREEKGKRNGMGMLLVCGACARESMC